MPVMLLPKRNLRDVIRRRQRLGHDAHDEVWDGVYVMAPIANNEHQFLGFNIARVFADFLPLDQATVLPACNISDQEVDWTKNYRCPDAVVFLKDNPAENRDTHWFGGPDIAVEVVSRGDHSRKKLGFYASVGVRELWLLDRKPWRLELYRLTDGVLTLVATTSVERPVWVTSVVVPLKVKMVAGKDRPVLSFELTDGSHSWLV